MTGTLAPWHPRASVRAAVAWCVFLPAALLLVLLEATRATLEPAWRLGAGLLALALVAVGAAALAAGPLRALARTLQQRAGDDLSALPLPATAELQPVVQGVNRLLEHQRSAVEQQKRFLADASHQLRTPLAVLRTQLQAAQGPAVEPRVAEMLRTVDRATHVVNELLAQMKLEQRRALGAPAGLLRVDQIAQEAALEFSPLIASRRLAFTLDALPVEVRADAWMMGELVRNLLANAIQHTPHGAPLGMVVRHNAGQPELVVWDSGAGIADSVRGRLFEPFAAATGGTGVGLGLSICRQLAQAMGAEVQLFNRSDGQQLVGVDAVVRWAATNPVQQNPNPGDLR